MRNRQKYEYKSVFKDDIKNLLYEKEQFLCESTLNTYKVILKSFDLWCIENNVINNILSEELISKWMIQKNTENSLTRQGRCTITRELARNMLKNKKSAYVIPKKLYRGINEHIPYIYTDKEITKLIAYFDNLKNGTRYLYKRETYSLIFKLLIYTGARISDILNLKVHNIDFDKKIISIIQGKEYIDRDIPITDDLTEKLKEYYNLLLTYGNDNSYFFSIIDVNNGIRNQVSKSRLERMFHNALKACDIEYLGISKGPRIHDFRYTFVVKNIKRLVEEGKDLNVYLPILSKYLGHSNLGDTLYYFRPINCIFDEKKYKNNNLIAKLDRNTFYEE